MIFPKFSDEHSGIRGVLSPSNIITWKIKGPKLKHSVYAHVFSYERKNHSSFQNCRFLKAHVCRWIHWLEFALLVSCHQFVVVMRVGLDHLRRRLMGMTLASTLKPKTGSWRASFCASTVDIWVAWSRSSWRRKRKGNYPRKPGSSCLTGGADTTSGLTHR